MDISSVGAASTMMHMAKTMQSVDVIMQKKVMDLVEQQSAQLIEQMEASVPPSTHNLDILI